MNEVHMFRINLDAPWDVGDAGEILDATPPEIIADMFALAHDHMHGVYAAARKHDRRRPWRWHRIPKLRKCEKHNCRELARRLRLVREVYQAREDQG